MDESDALTSDAQNALRRTMEKYSDICRFILSCLTENAKIYTADERELKISDYLKLFEERKIKTVLNRNGEDLVLAGVKYNSEMVGHPVYKITLESGRTIEATEDHKFLTNNRWMKISQLNEGDELLIYPTLEGVEYKEDSRKIINLKDFYNFLEEIELQGNYKRLGEADEFSQLTTKDKEVILNRALELYAKLHEGLTDRECEILNSIPEEGISREELQKTVGLSRGRLNQILQNIENKKYINRNINKSKKTQFIKNTSKNSPIILRNIMDIKRIIEREHNIKISYTAFKKLLNHGVKGFAQNHIKNIKERNWDSITYDSKNAGMFARLVGFIIGDGHLAKTEEKRIVITSTNNELKQIINDLTELNIKCSGIIEKEITNKIGERTVQGITSSIYIDNRTLYLLLMYWGIEIGNKTKIGYKVPEWIKEGNKFVKREFIRGLFGADGTKPNIKKYNANCIKLSLRCEKEALNKTKMFFEDIKCMLKEFDIDSKINERTIDNKYLIELIVAPNDENYIKYLSKISYAYEKDNFARIVGEYLRIKSYYKNNILKEIGNNAINEIKTTGNSIRKTAKKYEVSVDFVLNQMKGKKIGLPRDYMTYEQFIDKVVDNKYVSEKIIKKEYIGHKDVYDITCHNDHSFIANGFVSHNCNYPSRIIPPIQSRCAIFRFSPLKREDIVKKLTEIAQNENIVIKDSGIDAIIYVSEGDLRKAINVLQTASTVSTTIDEEIVYKVSFKARPDEIRKMIQLSLKGKFMEARELLYSLMIDWGMSGEDIVVQIFRELPNLDIEEKNKVVLAEYIGECDFRMVEGANERIQLSALLAKIGILDENAHSYKI